jgi:type VI secretion system protein ImpE
MEAHDLYRAGKLQEAIAAMNDEVRKNPSDFDRRSFLCELLCITGNLERADQQLDVMSKQDSAAEPALALLRQLVRAEGSRQDFHRKGAVPEFLGEPSASVQLRLKASVLAREGDSAGAAALISEAEEGRTPNSGTCDGEPLSDFRDLDDVMGDAFEVLTSTGKYYWVPFSTTDSVSFRTPERPLDLLWRVAEMDVRGGPDGVVYIPSIYGSGSEGGDDPVLLGRATDWTGGEGEIVNGIGLRTYLAGEEDKTILQLTELTFGAASDEA